MKTPTIVTPILFLGFLQTTLTRNVSDSKVNIDKWLSMTTDYVQQQCMVKNNYSLSLGVIALSYYAELQAFFKHRKTLKPYEYHFYHIYNPKLVEELKDKIKIIQDCINDKDRLNSEELLGVLYRILNAHARKILQVDPVVDEDTFEHCKLKVDHSKLRDCYISYPQVSKSFLNYGSTDNITIYQLLTLGLGIKFTCEEAFPFEQCISDVWSVCTPNARKMLKVLMSPPEIGICENYLQKTLPNFIEETNKVYHDRNYIFSLEKLFDNWNYSDTRENDKERLSTSFE